MDVNRKDLATGAIFIAFAAGYGTMSLTTMPVGTATQMGPGFFPSMLAGCLALLGLGVVIRAFFVASTEPFGAMPWRVLGMLSLATILFAAFVDDLGMLPGTFVTSFVACLASSKIKLWQAGVISLCIAAFCSLVFSVGLGVPLPIFGSLFRF
jgi:putative tricarboxylic transport membrane protein